ncbi:hypothetical protein ABG79_00964 [Caloramator mitchellensis]|uniref:Uncharacterized protein n=1 Tax=Caloramator mitchellensis TaxID=908809 RepID=A0A0R3K0X3_CALMK|nr:hypothetical protein [Caloramator mitchellensis]KRQ87166.1 hypothetical protein ABG79_00964 [Caloramator mitchellensis]
MSPDKRDLQNDFEKSMIYSNQTSPLNFYFYDINGNCNNIDIENCKFDVEMKEISQENIPDEKIAKIVQLITDFSNERLGYGEKLIIPIYIVNIYNILTNGNYNKTEV